jgi:hypothetical protein
MKHSIKIIVIALLLVGILAIATGCGNSVTQTPPNTSDFNNINSASSESINGLSLSLSLDAKTYPPGNKVRIVVDERNTLSTENNVSAADKWSYDHLTLGACGTNGAVYGIAVFQGYYTSADISNVTSLSLYDYSVAVPCVPPIQIIVYDFKPLRDIYTSQSSTSKAFAEIDITGHWTGSPNATLTNFDPGVYTVVAGDEWGGLVVVYFTVSNP